MRVTVTLVAAAFAGVVGSAVLHTIQQPGDGQRSVVTDEGVVEHRGELLADAETGCIVVPDESGPAPQVWRDQPPDEGLEVHAEPWPRCQPAE
jgi:hypothetical protein